MNYDNKLAQSIQRDYRREAQIERDFGSANHRKNRHVRIAFSILGLVLLTNLVMVAAS